MGALVVVAGGRGGCAQRRQPDEALAGGRATPLARPRPRSSALDLRCRRRAGGLGRSRRPLASKAVLRARVGRVAVVADPRAATCDSGRNQRPATRDPPSDPGRPARLGHLSNARPGLDIYQDRDFKIDAFISKYIPM